MVDGGGSVSRRRGLNEVTVVLKGIGETRPASGSTLKIYGHTERRKGLHYDQKYVQPTYNRVIDIGGDLARKGAKGIALIRHRDSVDHWCVSKDNILFEPFKSRGQGGSA